jgi:hypothetical protein
MSAEGVTLVARAGLMIYLILAGSILRALVGPGRKRDLLMLAGTLGGMSAGVAIAYPLSRWLGSDVSAIGGCLGMSFGWALVWLFARRMPPEAN